MIKKVQGKGGENVQYGKIRIEGGQLIFKKHMIDNSLPCCDIVWAYRRKEYKQEEGTDNYSVRTSLVAVTRRKKKYKFDMTEREAIACLEQIQKESPMATVGFPTGSRIPLVSLPNTRDLSALGTVDGRHILPGRLIRSGELYHVSKDDQKILLEEYHLRTVVDFRTEAERKEKPDTFMKGVRYIKNPILDEDSIGITHEKSVLDLVLEFPGDAEIFMEKQYRNLVFDEICTRQYAKFFDIVLNHEEGAILWHCSAGKDRVGVATALLLSALGVQRAAIMADFMRSNKYFQDEAEYMVRYIGLGRELTEEMEKNLWMMFQVKERWLLTVFEEIEREYGTVEQYLRKRMYLTVKAIEELKQKYLI